MRESIEGKIAQMRDRLGPSPLAGVFHGLDHVRYLVSAGEGLPLVAEISQRTSYRFTGAHRQVRSGDLFYEMRLDPVRPAIVVQECPGKLMGFPRLTALAFKVTDLEPVRKVFAAQGLSLKEEPFGLVSDPLPGLADHLVYVPLSSTPWHAATGIEPFSVTPPDCALKPFEDVLARIDHLDHIAYRLRLHDVEVAAELIMTLTAYKFDSCYTVAEENAETMVFRYGTAKPALVASYGWNADSVVHDYVAKYGPRVHHTAYYTTQLRNVLTKQKSRGLTFTTEHLIGNESRGILQVFSTPSPLNHEIIEYVERFGSFTGFFDKSNVGELMGSTRSFNQ